MTDIYTLRQVIDLWLKMVKDKRSENTHKACENAAKAFVNVIGDIPLASLSENDYQKFIASLTIYSTATEKQYSTLIYLFFEYVASNDLLPINIARLRHIRRYETRRIEPTQKELHRKDIEKLIEHLFDLEVPQNDLVLARAKSLVILCLESGLRVFELCKLRRNNLNFSDLSGSVIGKGNKTGDFFYTERFVSAINEYFEMRLQLEPKRGAKVAETNRPLFVSHSRRHIKTLKPIDTDTARCDLNKIIAIVMDKKTSITPHMLRHYFVNRMLEESSDIEIARIGARHSSIATTQKYLHKDKKKVQETHKKIWEKK